MGAPDKSQAMLQTNEKKYSTDEQAPKGLLY
jgi:hypothetical protein